MRAIASGLFLVGGLITATQAWSISALKAGSAEAAKPGNASAEPASCTAEVGQRKAEEYVAQCLQVSPATHPPCNVENPCSLIRDEISRGCAMLDRDAPEFCRGLPPPAHE